MLTDRERHALRMLEFHTRIEDPRFARRLERPAPRIVERARQALPWFLGAVLVVAVVVAVAVPSGAVGIVAFASAAMSSGLLALTLWTAHRQRRSHRRTRG